MAAQLSSFPFPSLRADTASLDQFKSFFLDKKLAKGTNVLLMYRTGAGTRLRGSYATLAGAQRCSLVAIGNEAQRPGFANTFAAAPACLL